MKYMCNIPASSIYMERGEMNGAEATTKAWKFDFRAYIQLCIVWAHKRQRCNNKGANREFT